jgi:predicted Zn-dependent protease
VIGDRALKQAAEQALHLAGGDGRQAEVTLEGTDSQLTRYANNEIHQHVAERDVTTTVRIAIGKKVGSASTNGMDEPTLRRLVEQATTVARLQRENADFDGFPGPFDLGVIAGGFAKSTEQATPEARAERVGIVCRRAAQAGFIAAGHCSTRLTETAFANSTGTFAYHAGTHARLQAVVIGDTSSGYSVRQGTDFDALDAETVANEAASKAERGRDPQDLEPGEYDVVLEPYAAEDVLDFIARLGLQGRSVLEKTSFATGKIGERVLSELVTLRDDPLHPAGLLAPFDGEGVPKRPLTLVNRGVVETVTYDTVTAHKAGPPAKTTGHALPGGGFYGPVATNLCLESGELDREALIGKIDRGLLVTRFWYTRPVHPLSVTVTGMTRDSTFLIERGQITRPVKNLRFTQSYVQALQQVIAVGSQPLLVGDSYGSPVLTPAIAIRSFTFTGKSEY